MNPAIRVEAPSPHLLRTPLGITLLAGLMLLPMIAGRWYAGGMDFSRFVVAGDLFTDSDAVPVPIQVLSGPGYDGQFFCRLAFDPCTSQKTDFGITLDSPSYRHQRIAYPALAWLLSLGRPHFVPAALVAVNCAAMLGMAWAVSRIALAAGMPAWAGLLPALFGGFLLSTGRDLAEPLCGLFVSLAVLAFLHRHTVPCVVCLSGAVLTREAALLTAVAVLVASIRDDLSLRKPRPAAWIAMAVPVLVFACWQLVLRHNWGAFPVLDAPPNRGLPLVGFAEQLLATPYLARPLESAVQMLYLAWHIWLGIEVLTSMFISLPGQDDVQRRTLAWVRTGWGLWVMLASSFTTLIWVEEWAFARILGEWSLLGLISMVLVRRLPRRPFLVLTLILYGGSVLRLILHP